MIGTGRRLLTVAQAMEEAGVSRRTIYHWMLHGKLEFVRTAGGGRRIYADSLFRPGSDAALHTSTPEQLQETGT